ncbi:MAG: TonB-dependent receptor [Bryobacteraceae bacterium]
MEKVWGEKCTRTFFRSIVLSLFCLSLAYAQENSGRILGTVTDETGASVPDAKIVATSPVSPRGIESTSDSNGNYTLFNVPIGVYTVSVTKTGFSTVKQANINVSLGSQVNYNPKLTVGQVSQVVEVSDSAVSLDTTSSRTSTNISAKQFDGVAKGRTFNSILAMAPGVRTEIKNGGVGVGGIQVDGSSGSENAFIIDGVDVSDVRRGSLRAQSAIPFEFIQEVQIKSGGFEAEYGGATGGVVNVATKGGSNEFHGQAFYEFTGSGLNARDRGYWQRSPLNANLADFFKPKEDDYSLKYPGGSLGGPILKNQLFFFGSFAPELEHTTRDIGYASGAKTYKQDIKRYYGIGRLDYQPVQKVQINTSYIWTPQKINGYLPSRDIRTPAPTNDLSIQGGFNQSQAYTISGTYAATSHLVLSVRFGYRYFNDKLGSSGLLGNYGLSGAPYIQYLDATAGIAGIPANIQGPNGFKNVSSTFGVETDITTRKNLYVDGTYVWGKHTFKGGYQFARLHNQVSDDYTNGDFEIYWGETYTRGSITKQAGQYGYYIWQDGVSHKGNVSSQNQGVFVQDSWRIHPRVTLNLGIRLESEYLPPYIAEQGGVKIGNPISFDWGSKVAPRLGAAWDIFGDGKWKLAGSFGLFYDTLKYELARGSFGSDHWISHVYKLDNPNVYSLSKATPGALGSEIINFNNRTLPINAQGVIDGVDPNIKPYESREFSVNVEHSLAARLVAGVRYTHKDLLRAIEDIGVLDQNDSEVYLIGNPGFGQTRNDPTHTYDGKTPNGGYLVPKAVRKYDGVEFRLQGQAHNFGYVTSYTWSRLFGNYSGAANSDESGRSDPGVSRAFDLPYYYFDATGSQQNVLGLLGTDRPHTFKFFGNYELKSKVGSTNFGLNQLAYSGTPDTTSFIYLSAPTFPYGRADMGRTPVFTQTDLLVSHTIKLKERMSVKLSANFINLFNQAAVISRVTQLNRSGAVSAAQLPLSQFFKGYDPKQFVGPNISSPAYNAIYGLPGASYRAGGGPSTTLDNYSSAFAASNPNFGAYQDFRVIRLGVRLIF